MDLNNSPARCGEPPPVPEAKFRTPGLDLANAINSLTDLTGTDGCTTRILGATVVHEIGMKSLIGSQDTWLRKYGASHIPAPPSNSE